MLNHFLNPPNWFTAASLACSSYAMMRLAGHQPDAHDIATSCWLVALGGLFDALDGRVARLLGRFSEFGTQLDSIADIVGFGVAPAIIMYTWKLHELGPVGVACAIWFAIAAAFRLARFNVGVSEGSWPLKGHAQGLTITMAGGLLVTVGWVCNGFLVGRGDPPPALIAGLCVVFGLGMVSSLPTIDFKDVKTNRYARVLLGSSLTSALIAAIFVHPSMFFAVNGSIYVAVGTIDMIVTAIRKRELLAAYHERARAEAKARAAARAKARAAQRS